MGSKILGFYFAEDKIISCDYDTETKTFSEPDTSLKAVKIGPENIWKAAKYTAQKYADNSIVGVGMAVPNPVLVTDHLDANYGVIESPLSPKRWQPFNVKDELLKALSVHGIQINHRNQRYIGVVSQVGATALGHFSRSLGGGDQGALSLEQEQRNSHHLYLVADYGIGCAIISKGWLFHGLAVPNIGHHLVIPREAAPPKPCTIHKERPCLNAFASMDAILARWPDLNKNWENWKHEEDESRVGLVAHYLAQVLSNVILLTSPSKIVLGGRVASNKLLLERIRINLEVLMDVKPSKTKSGYWDAGAIGALVEDQTFPHDGVIGAIRMVQEWVASNK